MSTTPTAPECVPLESGDRLSRAEFHRRYSTRPDIKKAELVEGVVFVASPVRINRHSTPNLMVDTWIGVFMSKNPGTIGGTNGTVRLDADNEVQPDAILAWKAPRGQAAIDEDD